MTIPDRLNTEQAAEYLGVPPKTLKNQRGLGVGPRSYRIMRNVWYDRADLDLYIAQQKAATLVGA